MNKRACKKVDLLDKSHYLLANLDLPCVERPVIRVKVPKITVALSLVSIVRCLLHWDTKAQ